MSRRDSQSRQSQKRRLENRSRDKPADEKVEKTALDEDVVASLHEAQAEEALAKRSVQDQALR